MQMVILCGGLATRLGDLAKNTPNSMIDIHGKPFLWYQIENLKKQKIEDIVLCVGHLSEKNRVFRRWSKARHKKIESTLRYDHTTDEMVIRHFETQRLKIDNLTDKDKIRILFNKYIAGEVDIETFKQSLDLLSEKERKYYEGVEYV